MKREEMRFTGRTFRLVRMAAGLSMLAFVSYTSPAVAPVNADPKGVAVNGYDVVAYFVDGRPVAGRPEFRHPWRGAAFQFASGEHRDLFAKDPERYAPQYGGYCAKAVSENSTAGIDPSAWKIVAGKLYLNYSPKVQALWEQDLPARIARADAFWPGLIGEPPAKAAALDPVPLYPQNYTVLFENDQVRVLDFRLRKGDREDAHAHPAHVAVFMADFKIRFTLPDGKTAIRDAKAGAAAYSDATTHASENIGTTDAHGILVELKGSPRTAGR